MKRFLLLPPLAALALVAKAQTPSAPDSVVERTGQLHEVQVVKRRAGVVKSRGVENASLITSSELLKAACCNLGESFTTNPSVDVDYGDAATGAKQIKLLGLSGQYVQMLTENVPSLRGLATPYALDYMPGPWMQSIQVSKGASSVKNGYESITGQINIEMLKPQAEERLYANVFGDSKSRVEANADANLHLGKGWSTGLLLHWQDNFGNHDGNGDGFLDMPKVRQYHVQNRWAYFGPRHIFQASVRGLDELRTGGQTTHGGAMLGAEPFGIRVETKRYEAFAKNAYILDPAHNTNVALILAASLHDVSATYGHKAYDETQKNAYASLLFETDFSERHSLSTGLSLNHDDLGEGRETTPGAYVQYTFNPNEQLTLMAGVRADHSSRYGTFFTPRLHVRYAPSEWLTFRASAGKGYRTVHALAENNYLLASARTLVVDPLEREEAWNFGASASLRVPLFGRTLGIDADYYYTHFLQQAVVDYDTDPTRIHITNLNGRSRSHTVQVEASYPIIDELTLTAAYRLNDVKTTYGGHLLERPLTNRYKALFTASFKPGLALWQFDATLQLNGGGRIPPHYAMATSTRYGAYEQLQAQVTREFRHVSVYVGGENLTNRRQPDPIIGAHDPWSPQFDPTLVWGPVEGRMFYAGVRIKFDNYKN